MATEYTRKQREGINRAWSWLLHSTDQDWSIGRKLRDAERYERKQRSSLTAARALLLECAFDLKGDGTPRTEPYTVADLVDLSDGCAMGVLVGAWMRKRETLAANYARGRELAIEAVRGHNESILAALDKI